MSLGACVVANEPASLKDAILQARIDGKSWTQIATDFNLGSPSAARSTFKKLTGIQDFKIKGQALKKIVDDGMVDDLKKAVPKKPPKAPGGVAPANTAAATTGAQGVGQAAPKVIFSMDDLIAVKNQSVSAQVTSAKKLEESVRNGYTMTGQKIGTLYDDILKDIQAGKFYSEITNKYGVSFQDVDGVFWSHSAKTGNVWDAYKKKPTSEFGFRAVQDIVWDLRKSGATQGQIYTATGIDPKVINLILENKWSLPGKGSFNYVTTPTGGGAVNWSQTATQLIGESQAFTNMTRAQADSWITALGRDLTPDQFSYLQRYTGSFYTEVNTALRSGTVPTRLSTAIDEMTASMKPIPQDVTLRRGVGREAFPGGVPKVGDAYTDKAFMSTSFGDRAAFSSKPYLLVIDAPAGTMARPLHQLSSFGRENEILLNRNSKFVVTGVQSTSSQTTVYMRAVP